METVALEWISCEEVEPRTVVQFVQQLQNVPEDALCEVGDIFCRRCRVSNQGVGNQSERRLRSEVQLSCEPRVTEFLCKKFGKQVQHVIGGELIRVRCKRVFPGMRPLGKTSQASGGIPTVEPGGDDNEDESCSDTQAARPVASEAAVLPLDKVIALIDLLGDQVVNAQDAYEFFADPDARAPRRMTMVGLTKALARLCKSEWRASSRARRSKVVTTGEAESVLGGGTQLTVESLRHLLSKLIQTDNVAVRHVPSATTVSFLSYTDFLACYVAFLASHH